MDRLANPCPQQIIFPIQVEKLLRNVNVYYHTWSKNTSHSREQNCDTTDCVLLTTRHFRKCTAKWKFHERSSCKLLKRLIDVPRREVVEIAHAREICHEISTSCIIRDLAAGPTLWQSPVPVGCGSTHPPPCGNI